jgi:NitT/TauT family transport system substrate-binding protein
MKLALSDMISNSYFPAIAAAELGFFAKEGIDVSLELMSPADKAYGALADGEVDLVGAEAHTALAAFPQWRGMKFLCALAQGMYWFLVVRADIGAKRGEIDCVRGRVIGASPWVDLGLRRLLCEAGIDPVRDGVTIKPVPDSLGLRVNYGVTAAQALQDGLIDGFWANGMGAAIAVARGVGTIVLDVRRGDGPRSGFDYTFAALAATRDFVQSRFEEATAVVRAIVAAQKALKADITLATLVGRKRFPAEEAALIAELIRRDLPFYDAAISRHAHDGLSAFARDVGILTGHPAYENVVALDVSASVGLMKQY